MHNIQGLNLNYTRGSYRGQMTHAAEETVDGQARLAALMTQHEAELAASRRAGDALGEGYALNNLAINLERQGQWREAISLYEEAIAYKRAVGDAHSVGPSLLNLGDLYAVHDMQQEARALHQAALTKLHRNSPQFAALCQRVKQST
jgi:tetratricopeptide (TPR) repeat protein